MLRRVNWLFVCLMAHALIGCASLPSGAHDAANTAEIAPPPNIVLVLFEDMSPRVGSFGDPLAHTPNFDRIASEGIRYTHVFTTSGVCAPSRAALITGQYQQTMGAQHMRTMGPSGLSGGGPQNYLAVPPSDVKAFPELLRRAGYYTSNNSKTDYQFGNPFTIWDVSKPGADWSGRAPDQPFFHMVSFFNTHESAIWPIDMETSNGTEAFLVNRNREAFQNRVSRTDPSKVSVPPYLPDTPVVRRDIATHYDNIAFTDETLGALYDRLATEGLLDNTILIVSTDHGDGLPRMKRSLYDSGLHVPMVIRFPDGRDAGTVNDELISFVDLAPTILSWARAPQPDHLHGHDFSGNDRDSERVFVFAAQDRMDNDPNRRRAVRDKRYKLIQNFISGDPYFVPLDFRDAQPTMKELWRGKEAGTLTPAQQNSFEPLPEIQLYDTQTDPHEVLNLSDDPAYAAHRTRLQAALDDWMVQHRDLSKKPEAEMILDLWPDGVQPVTAPPVFSISEMGSIMQVTLTSDTEGASIGYKTDASSKDWYLYTETLTLPADTTIYAKAIRYGYAESDVVSNLAD